MKYRIIGAGFICISFALSCLYAQEEKKRTYEAIKFSPVSAHFEQVLTSVHALFISIELFIHAISEIIDGIYILYHFFIHEGPLPEDKIYLRLGLIAAAQNCLYEK